MLLEIRQLVPPEKDQLPDTITQQAAELLVREIHDNGLFPFDEQVELFMRRLHRPIVKGYALVDVMHNVLAAATIELAPDYTFLADIATYPEHRHRGYGRAIMGRIATETIANDATGTNRVTLYANTPAPGFYEQLGFKEITDDGYTELAAHPREILSRLSSST
ncbi:MAG TPA: GNAT family N-acetyltransferase [Candidatus Saccharimonadales bacterium]|nr:GNAT family N-acetyltransferase [Candidatus Saccharimonadales bacterium]